MKKTIQLILILVTCLTLSSGCTENIRAKKFGGVMTIETKPGQKVVNATFKDSDLWILTDQHNLVKNQKHLNSKNFPHLEF